MRAAAWADPVHPLPIVVASNPQVVVEIRQVAASSRQPEEDSGPRSKRHA